MESIFTPIGVVQASTDDPWKLRFPVTPTNRRIIESLTTLSDGRCGTRGLLARRGTIGRPLVVWNGVFDGCDVPDLLPGPRWTNIELSEMAESEEHAELDLRSGVLQTSINDGDATVSATQFASIVRPGLQVLRAEGDARILLGGSALTAPDVDPGVTVEVHPGSPAAMTVTSDHGRWAGVGTQFIDNSGSQRVLTRLAAVAAGGVDRPLAELERRCRTLIADTDELRFDDLLAEHQAAWRERWERFATDLPTLPTLELALRFAQFHLVSSSHAGHEAAIGARGLTGPAYRGHVFWDADVFVVPALAAMMPNLARSALYFRWHRLDGARHRASTEGFAGARFPWESTDTGLEASPREGRDLNGNTVPIRTGQQEEHIVSDVAWSVANYVAWTGDERFLRAAGAEILMETARYWQSRIEVDGDGGHIRHVIGPDEYHEDVDDNAFTNVMARWNLREAASVCGRLGIGASDEPARWSRTADILVDGFDEARRVHEQFAGFFDLESVDPSTIGQPPFSADALLGRNRIQRVQIIKQPDVLMLHHLIPDDMPVGSLAADLATYLPLTAHGSSLSPAISASNLARAGRVAEAVRWFEMAARFDLDDLSGTTANGLHLATMGGLWQALTQGFLGIRPTGDGLTVDPVVPASWGELNHRFWYRNTPVRIAATADHFEITSGDPIAVLASGGDRRIGRHIVGCRSSAAWDLS